MIDQLLVALAQDEPSYPDPKLNPEFHPSEQYPEVPFTGTSGHPNPAYRAVREVLHRLGLDSAGFGTPEWNPLGELVSPGDRVVIKPNFVRHYHRLGQPLECVITHASILRPIMD